MGKQSRRDQTRALRQHEIIEVAARLFEKKSIENTTMDDIAREAEFTKCTLYAYFASKEDLYVAVFLESIQKRWEVQRAAMDASPDGMGKLRAFGQTYYSFFKSNVMYLRLMIYLDFLGIDIKNTDQALFVRYRARNEEMVDYLKDAFHQAMKEGSVRKDVDIDLTISQWGYSLRAILHRAIQKTYSFARFAPEKYYFSFFETLLKSISTEKTSKRKS